MVNVEQQIKEVLKSLAFLGSLNTEGCLHLEKTLATLENSSGWTEEYIEHSGMIFTEMDAVGAPKFGVDYGYIEEDYKRFLASMNEELNSDGWLDGCGLGRIAARITNDVLDNQNRWINEGHLCRWLNRIQKKECMRKK